MGDFKEVSNPHDRIFIDCDDLEAAQLAVLMVGDGAYGITGDGGLPILLFGGHEEWCQETHGKPFKEWVESISQDRIATALASMKIDGEGSSISDPVGRAHKMAQKILDRKEKNHGSKE